MALSISPGSIVRIDTDALRAHGGSRTNAQVTDTEDRAVRGEHDFLVVAVNDATREALALPLFPRSAPGSAPLDDALRSGPAEWRAQPVFYSRWQHWQIPLDALEDCAREGEGAVSRSYAGYKPDVLQDLANWATRNRCAFRDA